MRGRPLPPAAAPILGLLVTLLLGLAATACEAPLRPDSQETSEAGARTASPSPSASASPSPGPSPSQSTSPSRRPAPRRALSSPPTISVPKLPRLPRVTAPLLGADIGWPQCPKGLGIPQKRTLGLPLPTPDARFVVIGLTNGPGFVVNPCLADQVAFARSRHLLTAAYSVVSWPDARTLALVRTKGPFDGSTAAGGLANVGYQQALFNIASMRRAGLVTPAVWIDVEPVPAFAWSPDRAANAAVVRGAARGYADAGYRTGVYSTAYLWDTVVGDLELGLPEWRAAGETSRAEALRRCGKGSVVQGGESVLAQWVEAGRDRNLTCPGTAAELGLWFHQY